MLLTVSAVLPVLLIVIVAVAVEFTVTLPKVRVPLTPITLVGTAIPVPEMLAVLVPPVLSELTVTVPLYACTKVGLNVTVTFCEPPAAIVPLDQLPLNPVG